MSKRRPKVQARDPKSFNLFVFSLFDIKPLRFGSLLITNWLVSWYSFARGFEILSYYLFFQKNLRQFEHVRISESLTWSIRSLCAVAFHPCSVWPQRGLGFWLFYVFRVFHPRMFTSVCIRIFREKTCISYFGHTLARQTELASTRIFNVLVFWFFFLFNRTWRVLLSSWSSLLKSTL